MPRPTAAQFAYGTATVIFSTLAMLLLSQTRSVVGIASIAVGGLALGLFAAAAVPAPRPVIRPAGARHTAGTAGAAGPSRHTRTVPAGPLCDRPARQHEARAGAGSRVAQHSGRR